MDAIFKAYIDNTMELDFICKEFSFSVDEFFKNLADFCNVNFIDLDQCDSFVYEGVPFSLLLKFQFLLIKNNDEFLVLRSKPCSLELLEQIKNFIVCEKISAAIVNELKITKILNQIRVQERVKN